MDMKLSEAIRLGGMATKQGFGPFSIISNSAPCALGAACLAAGIKSTTTRGVYGRLMDTWELLRVTVETPEVLKKYGYLGVDTLCNRIWQLNDTALWTREQIADWVEGLEAQYADVGAVEPVVTSALVSA